ncbi:hypothetical protein [Luteimonas kalidii]|uniref:KAP NTPase domain-containing protein n=1 Tax=Luteimonas kalidii TaxID=3042025 RepID=A0ABT6JWM4_9GAMM|nr:hypothetical protein [Luteimonas kalidii]MDH5835087.1 hypothetical protein [Luteimonas kalidii]
MLIDESLRFFVNNLQPRALVMKGRWGVGKTFYWREQIAKEFFAHADLRRVNRGYAYVSLFGIETISQMRNSLAYSYIENQPPGLFGIAKHWVRKCIRRIASHVSKNVADELSLGGQELGIKVKATTLLNDFSFLSIRRSLICIDDLERRNGKLSIGDVLGLVSYLVDQRECRVILILNFDALPAEDREEWERSRDKVFEAELLYQPTLQKSVEVGMHGTELETWHNTVKSCLIQLEIDNVRVVARAQRFVRQLIEEILKDKRMSDVSDEAWAEIAKTATLLSAANASRNVGAPDILEIIDPQGLSMLGDGGDADLSDEQNGWKKRISEYGLYFGDDLDKAIAQSVLDGFPRTDLLVPAVLEWGQIRQKHEREQKFRRAWDLYHSSLEPDDANVFDAFQEALPGIVGTEAVHNIESTGRLLRVMGHPDAATKLFKDWIDARRGERSDELFEESFFPGTIVTDAEFKDLIESARIEETRAAGMLLVEALVQIDSSSHSNEAVASIAAAHPEEIAEVLVREKRTWRQCARTLGVHGPHDDVGRSARARFLAALKIIAETSPLNADRVRNKLGGLDVNVLLAELQEQG